MNHDAGIWFLFTFIFIVPVLIVCAVAYFVERKNGIWSGPLDLKEFRDKFERANAILNRKGQVGELYTAIALFTEAFKVSGQFAERIDLVIDELYVVIRNYRKMYKHNNVGCAAAWYWEHIKGSMRDIRVSLDSINEELEELDKPCEESANGR